MVVTCAFAAMDTVVMQDRSARPLICTVQAAHWPMPQPYLVPCSLSMSRSAHNRGISAGASRVTGRPLTVSLYGIAFLQPKVIDRKFYCDASTSCRTMVLFIFQSEKLVVGPHINFVRVVQL